MKTALTLAIKALRAPAAQHPKGVFSVDQFSALSVREACVDM